MSDDMRWIETMLTVLDEPDDFELIPLTIHCCVCSKPCESPLQPTATDNGERVCSEACCETFNRLGKPQ